MSSPRKAKKAATHSPRYGPAALAELLERHRAGQIATADALATLSRLPFADLGFARPDHHRHLRRGFPEVIYGPGKTQAQIEGILAELRAADAPVMVTRLDKKTALSIRRSFAESRYFPEARILSVRAGDPKPTGRGTILVVTAGTSDLSVAEEAAVTATLMGNTVDRLNDVGVAGIHRLFAASAQIEAARVIIVVAGMEGALASVVGGLVRVPVIAVPTSTGYGASFGGVAALLAMLNSCASGVTVVNIDNGFGAAAAASTVNHL